MKYYTLRFCVQHGGFITTRIDDDRAVAESAADDVSQRLRCCRWIALASNETEARNSPHRIYRVRARENAPRVEQQRPYPSI